MCASATFQAHQDEASMRFAFKKVTERLRAKQRVENELRRRIKQAETRQESDDKMMVVINRYWNQLNDDVRVLLMRFDAEAALDAVKTGESVGCVCARPRKCTQMDIWTRQRSCSH
jgi:hypothetical protein